MRKKDDVVTEKEEVGGGNIKLVLEHKGLPYEEFMQMMSESGRKFGKDVWPFLRPERRDKIEQAVRAARLIHAGQMLLGTLGDGHV